MVFLTICFNYVNAAGYGSFFDSEDPLGNSVDTLGNYINDYELIEGFVEVTHKFPTMPVTVVLPLVPPTSIRAGWSVFEPARPRSRAVGRFATSTARWKPTLSWVFTPTPIFAVAAPMPKVTRSVVHCKSPGIRPSVSHTSTTRSASIRRKAAFSAYRSTCS